MPEPTPFQARRKPNLTCLIFGAIASIALFAVPFGIAQSPASTAFSDLAPGYSYSLVDSSGAKVPLDNATGDSTATGMNGERRARRCPFSRRDSLQIPRASTLTARRSFSNSTSTTATASPHRYVGNRRVLSKRAKYAAIVRFDSSPAEGAHCFSHPSHPSAPANTASGPPLPRAESVSASMVPPAQPRHPRPLPPCPCPPSLRPKTSSSTSIQPGTSSYRIHVPFRLGFSSSWSPSASRPSCVFLKELLFASSPSSPPVNRRLHAARCQRRLPSDSHRLGRQEQRRRHSENRSRPAWSRFPRLPSAPPSS